MCVSARMSMQAARNPPAMPPSIECADEQPLDAHDGAVVLAMLFVV